MEEAKIMKTPMNSSIKLDKDEKGKSRLLLGHRASTQLSRLSPLNRRLAERQGLTPPYLAPWYKQKFAQRKVVSERSINFSHFQHFRFKGLFSRMGCLPMVTVSELIFPNLVLADAQGIGKPSAHSLTVISRVLHHMICSILLPRGGHRDEVSYYEAFLMDSILTGRRIHLRYPMMMHMISCCESTTRVLPYGCFLTTVFKDVGVDLSKETNFETLSVYVTYDEQCLG
ncbi:hypothetical protein CK203_049894 [Vitis vinifera]|uniref:Uncharacterized protein n=1 Tax=Vitis vinifera TaxID=29760 RepID=A0A438GVY4_VITVI|nr:hypothetical protein CK203_049894 [Vitis vinifera]